MITIFSNKKGDITIFSKNRKIQDNKINQEQLYQKKIKNAQFEKKKREGNNSSIIVYNRWDSPI